MLACIERSRDDVGGKHNMCGMVMFVNISFFSWIFYQLSVDLSVSVKPSATFNYGHYKLLSR